MSKLFIHKLQICDNREHPKYLKAGPEEYMVKVLGCFIEKGEDGTASDARKRLRIEDIAIDDIAEDLSISFRVNCSAECPSSNHGWSRNFKSEEWFCAIIAIESDKNVEVIKRRLANTIYEGGFESFCTELNNDGALSSILGKDNDSKFKHEVAVVKYAVNAFVKSLKSNNEELIGVTYLSPTSSRKTDGQSNSDIKTHSTMHSQILYYTIR